MVPSLGPSLYIGTRGGGKGPNAALNPPRPFAILIPVKIVLAGYNVDAEVLEELKRRAPARDDVTPETLSAAYARISRDPRPADELRAAARREVEGARRSNRRIIFGMGHHSVAEHAVFNFDVIGVSRLAIEDLERFRLCSFTEKSQRYIKLGDDFVMWRRRFRWRDITALCSGDEGRCDNWLTQSPGWRTLRNRKIQAFSVT